MKEKRMMILSMLEEGKITSEEAVKLLEALEETEDNFQSDTTETAGDYTEEKKNTKGEIKKNVEDIKKNAKKIEVFGANLGNLISNIVSNIVDKGTSFSLSGLYETVNANIERDISNIENPTIDFESVNGGIKVRPWKDDKISIDVTIKYKGKGFNEDEVYYKFYEENGTFRFKPAYRNNLMISLDVNLPNKYYKEITLKTTNGSIKIHDFQLGELMLETSNGSITVGNISSNKMDLLTQNGRILLNDISASIITAKSSNASIVVEDINSEDLNISTINGKISFADIQSDHISGKTSNASIELKDIISKKVRLKTSNGAIVCRGIDERNIDELDLSTSNSSIDVALNNMKKTKYFDLETTLGSISLEVPDLVYKVNKQVHLGDKKIVAHSTDFDEAKEHFLIKASTSNGSIKIR